MANADDGTHARTYLKNTVYEFISNSLQLSS